MNADDVQRDESQAAATENATEPETTAPTIDEAIIKRRAVDVLANPNQRFVDSMTVHRSSKQSIEAVHLEIIDQHTGEVHHHAVKLEQTPRQRVADGGGWPIEVPISIQINDVGKDAIGKLRDFLSVVRDDLPEEIGDFIVAEVRGGQIDVPTIRRLIGVASTGGKAEALVQAAEAVSGDPEALERIAELAAAHPDASKVAAAALNLARYNDALAELERLIEANARESEFQRLLTDNAWIFGSEYSELLNRRVWVRDQQKDFMLRRAADDYLEIIEIKTPLETNQPLFLWDNDHDSHYPRGELTKVVAQVMSYLDGVDGDRDRILARDKERVNKIVARVVIGRDHDQGDVLRRFNGHLARIEVLTYDQLLKIGRRVAAHVEQVVKPLAGTDNIPAVIGLPPTGAEAEQD